ncbi:hypothetical protein D5S17_13520 [Pseudonocardiaceae bacterium YIM PH 21723]|nr:hypothetical protein D5S17_13520 [Pseudonocardiaceae bacterium YIM PH 21723]
MTHTRMRRIGALAVGLTLALLPLSTANAAEEAVQAGKALQFSQLKQDKDQWCWAASGLAIARYLGKGGSTTQNQFCNMSRNLAAGGQCPNQPGYLQWVQNGHRQLGLGGGAMGQALPFATVKAEIDGNRPIETGIQWTAGGGHAQVIYGYDSTSQRISYGDPWPSSATYSEMAHSSYVSNGQFRWSDSLYRAGM